MSAAALQSLHIRPDAADPVLAQRQSQFNTLVRDVAAWRAALADWQARIDRYRQAVEPVRRELHAAWRQWVFALDHASLQAGLARAERRQLEDLLRETAAALLEGEDDAEIAAVARRHDDGSTAAQAPSEAAVDAEADADVEPLLDPAQDWEEQAAAAAARRERMAAQRRAGAAARRRRQETQEVSQSLRDVYRRLASVLHPDREPDGLLRERKTALMQQANQAYAADDLLALLELQLQAEQVDAAHLANVGHKRLQHYVTVLQDQLAELQAETRRLEAGFRAAVGLPPGTGLQPRKADRTISAEAQRLRAEVLLLQRQTRVLLDLETTRAWLRELRRG